MKRTYAIESSENEYYARISRKLRNAKYLLLLLMVVCALLTLWAYRDRFTYGNLRYLLRDMDAAGTSTFSSDTVYYTADEKNTYAYFKNDLAVASSDGVAFHRALGSRSFFDEVNFRSPVLATSKKYMLAYDVGGSSFYVYNSLGRVYDERLENEIVSAAAGDNGNFCILSKNKMGGCDADIYDKNFKKTASLTRTGDAYNVGFLDGGSRMYILESVLDDSTLFTDITFYTVGEQDTDETIRTEGFAVKIFEMRSGLYILGDRSLSVRTADGTHDFPFDTADLLYADAYRDSVCIIQKENAMGEECAAYLFGAGKMESRYSLPKGVKGAVISGGRICALYDGEVLILHSGEVTSVDIPTGARAILSASSGEFLVCYNDYAKMFSVK